MMLRLIHGKLGDALTSVQGSFVPYSKWIKNASLYFFESTNGYGYTESVFPIFCQQKRSLRIPPGRKYAIILKKKRIAQNKKKVANDSQLIKKEDNVAKPVATNVENSSSIHTQNIDEDFPLNDVAKSLSEFIIRPNELKLFDSFDFNKNFLLAKKVEIPNEYPLVLVLPISYKPLFPGMPTTIQIKDLKIATAIMFLAKQNQPYIGVFLAKDEKFSGDIVSNLSEIYNVGVLAEIRSIINTKVGSAGLNIFIYPYRRIRIEKFVNNAAPLDPDPKELNQKDSTQKETTQKEPTSPANFVQNDPVFTAISKMNVPVALVKNLEEEPFDINDPVIKISLSEIISLIRELCAINPLIRTQIIAYATEYENKPFANASRIVNIISAISTAPMCDLQMALECTDVRERLHFGISVLKAELENAKLQQTISKQVEKKITKRQRDYFLMEQLKEIQRELGISSDGKEKLIEEYKMKALSLKMPDEVASVFNEEIVKLMHLEMSTSEFNVSRNYLDWLTNIPWGIHSKENFDVLNARSILDEDHYGLDDIKDIILELIAIGKLKNSLKGKVICLCGPPGVGKTSIGKSIAKTLNRAFFRFSVGGLTDVSEIKGHRRTYVGAMPGKPVQALKRIKTHNPLIMIDEIDKIGPRGHGDPASALLELLDPEQNYSFLDHYIDLPIDMSNILFICTANETRSIPSPLLDRMEVMYMSGYILEEKVEIAIKCLLPDCMKMCGLTKNEIKITRDALHELTKYYCRESGVRNLKKHIEKICRKVVLKVAALRQCNEALNNASSDKCVASSMLDGPQTLSKLNCTPHRNMSSSNEKHHDLEKKETTTESNLSADKMPDPTSDHSDHEKSSHEIKTTSESSVSADKMPDPISDHGDHEKSSLEKETVSQSIISADYMPDPKSDHGDHEKSYFQKETESELRIKSDKLPTLKSNEGNHDKSHFEKETQSELRVKSDKMPNPKSDEGNHDKSHFEKETQSELRVKSDKMPNPKNDEGNHDKSHFEKETQSELRVKADKMTDLMNDHGDHQEKVMRNNKSSLDAIIKNAKDIEFPIIITAENVKEYVGPRVYNSDRLYEGVPPVGVITGLAWTELGGTVLHIETIAKPLRKRDRGASFEYTGKLGKVMRESAEIAYTYSQILISKICPSSKFFEDNNIHLHVPEGAKPKDGPSAGCTMVTSIVSLALNTPVSSDIAMTGEITLTGKILKVGGIKVKVIAARRSGVKKVILPKPNEPDWKELPDYVKAGLDVYFVNEYQDVFDICFPGYK